MRDRDEVVVARDSRKPAAEHRKPHHVIESLEITDGFLAGAKLQFKDGLNCILGPRGTGKTTILELCRFAFGLMPDAKSQPDRAEKLESVIANNLGPAGRVRLRVRTKDGVTYIIERSMNEPPVIKDLAGNRKAITLDGDLIFQAEIYSQHEIEDIATTPALQRALLDRFVAEDVRSLELDERSLLRALDDNSRGLAKLEGEIVGLQESSSEVANLAEKLKSLEKKGTPDADAINAAHQQKAVREKEKRMLATVPVELVREVADLETAFQSSAQRIEGRIDAEALQGANKKPMGQAREVVRDFQSFVEDSIAKIKARAQRAEDDLAAVNHQLVDIHAKQEAAFRALIADSEGERDRALERGKIEARFLDATAAKKELETKEKERVRSLEKREGLLGQLSDVRDKRYRHRAKVAERLTKQLDPWIRVSVTHAGSRDAYRRLLIELLHKTSTKQSTTERMVLGLNPVDLAGIVRRRDAQALFDRAKIEVERGKTLIDHLRKEDLLHRIETVQLEDAPLIELKEGKNYLSSSKSSTGQRCSAVLPILLLDSMRPVLIDQPEDNLNNAYIYSTIVKTLRKVKLHRQLIFITHNPNIPMLADADWVFVMEGDGGHASLKCAGTVDQLKKDVELLLEGGEEPFLLRKTRYGH